VDDLQLGVCSELKHGEPEKKPQDFHARTIATTARAGKAGSRYKAANLRTQNSRPIVRRSGCLKASFC
jgi:hypothetical protein